MQLPRLTRKSKYIPGIIVLALVGASYSLTNHHHLFTPQTLPNTFVDRNTPFIPYSIWIYYSYYLIFSIAYVMEREKDKLDRYLSGVVIINMVSVAIFIAYPTMIDRNSIIQFGVEFYQGLYKYLHTVDSPANCFPSLHVSISLFTALLFYGRDQRRFWMFFAWAMIISISTLTTKQHYFIDVLAGVILALVCYWLSFYKFRLMP